MAQSAQLDLLGPREFVGLRNWRSVLGDAAFGHALLVTLALTVIVVPAQTVLGSRSRLRSRDGAARGVCG